MIRLQETLPSVLLVDVTVFFLAHSDDADSPMGEHISFFMWQETEGSLWPTVSKELSPSSNSPQGNGVLPTAV